MRLNLGLRRRLGGRCAPVDSGVSADVSDRPTDLSRLPAFIVDDAPDPNAVKYTTRDCRLQQRPARYLLAFGVDAGRTPRPALQNADAVSYAPGSFT